MSTSPNAVIRLDGVSKRYGQNVTALSGVTLDVGAGEFTAIMGTSGSGKSTLMHVAAGLDSATEGTVILDGVDITSLGDKQLTELRRRRVGFVFQSFNLVPTLNILENVELPIILDGRKPSREERDRIRTLIDRLGLGARVSHRPSQLSGGQQQRVAIARALARKPAVIFADEPTGALDTRSSNDVLAILRETTRDLGHSVVMVTHDPAAAAIADRIVFLSDGQVRADRGNISSDEISRAMLALEPVA
ncbi:ABC transporter ATP-binding protein [Pseudoclavibacter sp. VKM Ac-2888]|uniref:ABC transporter ATP-binding protein n=1 Tax=Pseudoclavibacter sp. VKM Ac-2888 TaxID=2783830 RepID=UPI00188C32CF|nr:ABC transporter ATP-binding protein [Pseudoclavibacter sp. VKM Ac-2888]MBF4549483.1 ABC transporter ATP-binding protein [Pseudoclavibacter sp. VKM Ac-2888]